jgi:hypothetical protein
MLIRSAKEAVAAAPYCPRKLTAIHAGIAAAASILVALLSYILHTGIGSAGGLSGIGTIAILETAQSMLDLMLSILSPFWNLGFVAAAVRLARRQEATPRTLTTGLHRWGPALRMMLLEGVIYFVIMMLAVQAGSILYSMTPLAAKLQEAMQPIIASGEMDPAAMAELVMQLDPSILLSMLPFTVLPALVVMLYVTYRLRLAQFILMDEPRVGAMHAALMSFRLTRKQVKKLVLLDLRYWWFYGLDILVLVLCYGDLLLPLCGVKLGMDPVLASFLFYALALVCQVALYAWKKPQVMATYALFYDDLLPRTEAHDENEEI